MTRALPRRWGKGRSRAAAQRRRARYERADQKSTFVMAQPTRTVSVPGVYGDFKLPPGIRWL